MISGADTPDGSRCEIQPSTRKSNSAMVHPIDDVTDPTAAELSARFPIPEGVLHADNWPSLGPDDERLRYLVWHELNSGPVSITVGGFQSGLDGSVEKTICWAVEHGGADFTAAEARTLAAALTEAADALDCLE